MSSDSTLISMPLKGLAALMNHSISFSCSSFAQRRRLELVVDPLLRGGHVREGRRRAAMSAIVATADNRGLRMSSSHRTRAGGPASRERSSFENV